MPVLDVLEITGMGLFDLCMSEKENPRLLHGEKQVISQHIIMPKFAHAREGKCDYNAQELFAIFNRCACMYFK